MSERNDSKANVWMPARLHDGYCRIALMQGQSVSAVIRDVLIETAACIPIAIRERRPLGDVVREHLARP